MGGREGNTLMRKHGTADKQKQKLHQAQHHNYSRVGRVDALTDQGNGGILDVVLHAKGVGTASGLQARHICTGSVCEGR